MRPGVHVVPATVDVVDPVVDLCLEARAESGVGAQLCSADRELLRNQVGTFLAAPGSELLYGTLDGAPAGILLARVVGPSPFTDEVSLHVEALYVAEGARRRGVGHALLESLLEIGQAAGAVHVFALPLPGARGMQRLLVRLGFAPAAAHRVATLASLQRRLQGEPISRRRAHRSHTRGLEHLIARRRKVREETMSGGIDSAAVRERVASEAEQLDRAGAVAGPTSSSLLTTVPSP